MNYLFATICLFIGVASSSSANARNPLVEIYDRQIALKNYQINKVVETDKTLAKVGTLAEELFTLTLEQQKIKVRFLDTKPDLHVGMGTFGLNIFILQLPPKENNEILQREDWIRYSQRIDELTAEISKYDDDFERLSLELANFHDEAAVMEAMEYIRPRLSEALERYSIQNIPEE